MQHLYLKIITEVVDVMLKRIPLKKLYLKVVKLGLHETIKFLNEEVRSAKEFIFKPR